MVKLKDITKEVMEVVSCRQQRFIVDEELIKDAKERLNKTKTPAIAIPAEDFLKAFGREPDDKTTPYSIVYCINEQLRDLKKPYRKYNIQVGVYTKETSDSKGKKISRKMFTFKSIDWDTWDEEHSRTTESPPEAEEEGAT